ncbi:MAG: dNTP triphosphohydrolase [Thermoanaerobaculales bacterium]|jgi:dGTPase|nr:dNTP triphosphohydrolase [Thermoanaerobaculales bacterium]
MSRPTIRSRRELELDEDRRLAVFALRSSEAVRRGAAAEPDTSSRLAFQRDRDRILHSRAFRRLKHKTQVFVPHVADHPRTRLTHTLEVSQLGRTVARSLGLNEDLVEAVALGHDLGHTAFGHTGETVLDEILHGANPEALLPAAVAAEAGSFKHNYQSLRVVDLLEWRYDHAGLDLTDQVREGILKHTRWRVGYDFPLPDASGLALEAPCHLEGQAVAVADEIAQQTHDLEDGLRAGSVSLEAVERLEVCRRIIAGLGDGFRDEGRRWLRQSTLIRELVGLFVDDVVAASARRIDAFLDRHSVTDHAAFVGRAREVSQTTIWFSPDTQRMFDELKAFIYQFIINHIDVNRQDWRARKVISALYRAFWTNPLTLPTYVLLRARTELGLPFLRDVPLASVAEEVAGRYHASAGFARLIADHIAGMSDRFALEEFNSLESPSLDQTFGGRQR